MATYALTVSTNALGLGVISGATVVVERKRTTVNDIYPTSSLSIRKIAANVSGIATIQLEADDGTVFHEIKIFDASGVLVYKNTIQMPPQAADIEDLPLNDIITESAYQAVQAKEDTLTLKNAAQTSATNAANSASSASENATNANNSANAASTSATNANNSANAASTSATNASNAQTAAELARDEVLSTKTEINNTFYAYVGGRKAYRTLALAQADQANLPANTAIDVTNDTTSSNNGTYQWNGTTLTKSAYDPLTYSKTYTDDSLRTLESNRPQNPNKLDFKQVTFLTAPTVLVGTATYPYHNGIKQLKLVSASTGSPITVYWEFPVSQFTREFSASITVEGLTSGSNGVVGIEQRNDANSLISSHYAATGVTSAITKQTYKVNVSGVTAGATKIRLIVNMLTTGTREMYVNSPFIADGLNAEFIAPRDTMNENLLLSTFIKTIGKNQFNKALAEDGKLISYQTGATAAFANGIAFGKHPVQAGGTYTFWMPLSTSFAFKRIIYTYDKNGGFLGINASQGSAGEVVNPNPPTNITYADSDKTVTFTIPDNSTIAFISMMIVYAAHTTTDFNNLINEMQLELGNKRTDYAAYDANGVEQLYLKSSALLDTPESGGSTTVVEIGNTFTVYIDGTYAYIRTPFNDTLDMVQLVQYGTNTKWLNNIVNPYQIKTIPASTAKENLITAYNAGTLVVTQGDDAAPLRYNGTYIGANHGAFVVHQVTKTAHGKAFVDVGSKWSNGTREYTLLRIVDANTLWFISDNTGTSTQWIYNTTSTAGNTLTHVSGATNTSSILVATDTITQLYCAVNDHVKKVTVDGYKPITTSGFYDVESIEFNDSYNIMNVPAIVAYAQANVGTATELEFTSNTIDWDVRVQAGYRYAINGSLTINTQLYKKSAINFEFAGLTHALPLNYSGKTLLQYVPKMNTVTVSGTPYNLSNVIDVTNVTAVINMLKADWSDATNPPDRMAQVVKNGATKEYGHVIGYSLTRGDTRPLIRQNTTDAGFFNGPTKKMYPKALVGNLDTVSNTIAYRSLYNPNLLPEATVYTWYEDNGEIFVVLDIHQSASMLKLPLPAMFNGKSAEVVDSHANFTLHSEIVSDGGLLCSIINSYGQATIKLT